MKTRTLHRIIGLIMLLPLAGWAVTGAIFFIKPGYASAYEALPIKTYPLDGHVMFNTDPSWLEVRYLRTKLGTHLLARTEKGWQHLDAETRQVRPAPTDADVRALMTDAFSINPARYGHIVSVEDAVATTDTGVRVSLAWNRLSLSQRGNDTDRIDALYKVHYLQWTGVTLVDQTLGALGLVLIVVLAVLGVRLSLR